MKLLQPITIRNTTFKNRLMFPPMSTGYEDIDGSIGEHSFNFYKRLAEGGTGYIVLGNITTTDCGPHFAKIHSEEDLPSFKRLADACHSYGARLGVQLFFREYDVEENARLLREGKKAEAREKMIYEMQHFSNEASTEKLRHLISCMANSAALVASAGIDVIQIHGDRLNGALLSTTLNKRTDEFGGSFENRVRFALEQVKAVRAAAPNIVIEYKLSIRTLRDNALRGNGGLDLEESIKLAKLLEEAGCDMIHPAQANHTGNFSDTIPPMGIQPYGTVMKEAVAIKKAVSIPVSCVARIITPQAAEAILEAGKADFVAMGRPLLSDPYMGNKCAEGKINQIRTCMMCNKGCTDSIVHATFINCVLNPENGYEASRFITKAAVQRKVAVIGSGIAGLEAARVAALKGHSVDVFEKAYRIGGQINLAAVPPRKEEMLRSIHYYEEILSDLDVTFHMGTNAKEIDFSAFDHVIVASGAENIMLNVPGSEQMNVVSAWDVLDRKAIVFGNICVIGGGLVGAETAEYLGKLGFNVTVVEMLDKIAATESVTIRPYMMENFDAYGITQLTNTKLKEIKPDCIICESIQDGEKKEIEIPTDFVVMAVGAKQVRPKLKGVKGNVTYVGDCAGSAPSDISNATKTAYDAANAIN